MFQVTLATSRFVRKWWKSTIVLPRHPKIKWIIRIIYRLATYSLLPFNILCYELQVTHKSDLNSVQREYETDTSRSADKLLNFIIKRWMRFLIRPCQSKRCVRPTANTCATVFRKFDTCNNFVQTQGNKSVCTFCTVNRIEL